jgi:hypothetical protein
MNSTDGMTIRQRHIAHLCLHAALTGDQYADIIEPASGVTPHVQAVPPNAVRLDLTSALGYFDLSPYDMVQTTMMRLKALYDIDSSAGLAGNRMPAAMAADASAPAETTWVPPLTSPTGCTRGRSPRSRGSALPQRTRSADAACTPSARSAICPPGRCSG